MQIIVCLDPKNGMMFNHRRQSRDREVLNDIFKTNDMIYITPYSKTLFNQYLEKVTIYEDVLDICKNNGICFIEDKNLKPYENDIDVITVYYWDKEYPADLYFDIDLTKWKEVSNEIIKGFSHEEINKIVYRKEL